MSDLRDHNDPTLSYQGLCSVCGRKGTFVRGTQRSVRESYACPSCGATLRWRDQAACLVDELGRGMAVSLAGLAGRPELVAGIRIYEPALGGYLRRQLGRMPGYTNSYYWPDGRAGEVRDGVEFQDLAALTFESESFDVVVTSDVFEHVFDPYAAFDEVRRVLKVGGVHVCSIPMYYPLPAASVERARLDGGEVSHLLEPVYHRAGDGSDSLVVTDWGADIIDGLGRLGMATELRRVGAAVDPAYINVTVVSRRMS